MNRKCIEIEIESGRRRQTTISLPPHGKKKDKPSIYKANPNDPTSSTTPHLPIISSNPLTKLLDVNTGQRQATAVWIVKSHLNVGVQFRGLAGSFGGSQDTR